MLASDSSAVEGKQNHWQSTQKIQHVALHIGPCKVQRLIVEWIFMILFLKLECRVIADLLSHGQLWTKIMIGSDTVNDLESSDAAGPA
jgi:hypothetical protein